MKLDRAAIPSGGRLQVSVTVENTGAVAGDEVAALRAPAFGQRRATGA